MIAYVTVTDAECFWNFEKVKPVKQNSQTNFQC